MPHSFRSVRATCALLSLITSLAACDSDGDTTLTGDNFCDSFAAMACEAVGRCDCLASGAIVNCLSAAGYLCKDGVEEPVDEGRRRFDQTQAAPCLAALEAMAADCSAANDRFPTSCERMLVAVREEGQACEDDEDCIGTIECRMDVCTKMPVAGEACIDGYDCAEGYFCDRDDVCQAERPAGSACPEGDKACVDGLFCANDETCQQPRAQGAACPEGEEACGDGLYCDRRNDTCAPPIAGGESCAHDSFECADGFYCHADTEICTARQSEGSACTTYHQCLSDDCDDNRCTSDQEERCQDLLSFDWP